MTLSPEAILNIKWAIGITVIVVGLLLFFACAISKLPDDVDASERESLNEEKEQ